MDPGCLRKLLLLLDNGVAARLGFLFHAALVLAPRSSWRSPLPYAAPLPRVQLLLLELLLAFQLFLLELLLVAARFLLLACLFLLRSSS